MRRQLAVVVLATTSTVVIAFLVPLGLLVRTMAHDRALQAAQVDAESLSTLLATVPDPQTLELTVERLNQSSGRTYTLYLPGGGQLGAVVAAGDDVALARTGRAFSVSVPGGRAQYVPVELAAGQRAVVRAFVPDDVLGAGVRRSWLLLGALGLALLLVAALLADRLARSVLAAVSALAATARALEEGRLDARVVPGGPPELGDLGRTMNRLAERIGDLVAAERETVAALSHRLHAPVTALRRDVEALSDPREASRLAADVDAVEGTVAAIIRETRRPVREELVAGCDAVAVTRERVAFWAPLAEDQKRDVDLRVPGRPVPVALPAEELAAALDALLGNVVAHTPEGTPFAVTVEPPGRVLVEDAGPGLPGPALLGGEGGVGSTGSGLDIARRTAESAGGRLVLGRAAGGGARVVLELPGGSSPQG
jgi:signal transduction histidine kinase